MNRIAQAKRAAAEKYQDKLPFEALQAGAQSEWPKNRAGFVCGSCRASPACDDEQIGEEVFVPTPGQEVGSRSALTLEARSEAARHHLRTPHSLSRLVGAS